MSEIIRKLYIEPTSRCNLNCAMCFRHTWVGESTGDLPYEVFARVLADPCLDGCATVLFGGMGEPMVHPRLLDMVAAAKGRGCRVELLSNGTLLTQQMSQALMDAGLDELWLSIDGLDEGEGTGGHGGQISLVRRNLDKFNQLRALRAARGQGQVGLGLTYVLMKSNVSQLKALPDFAKLMFAQHVNISHVLPNTAEMERELLYESLFHKHVNTGAKTPPPDIWGAPPKITLPPLDLELPQARDGLAAVLDADCPLEYSCQPVYRKRQYCKFVEEGNVFVRWDGDVSPCMGLLHSATVYLAGQRRTIWHHAFGNVKGQPLGEIWAGAEYAAFRERVRKFDFSPCIECGGCERREENREDCIGSPAPTCGACLWSEGILFCP